MNPFARGLLIAVAGFAAGLAAGSVAALVWSGLPVTIIAAVAMCAVLLALDALPDRTPRV